MAAKSSAADANHTLRLMVSEKNRVYGFSPVGSCTRPYTPSAIEAAAPASRMPNSLTGTDARVTDPAVDAVMPDSCHPGARYPDVRVSHGQGGARASRRHDPGERGRPCR